MRAAPNHLCLLVFLLAFHASTQAAIFVVGNTNDTLTPSSLRGAVLAANRLGGNNTILLYQWPSQHTGQSQPWIYRLTRSGAGELAGRTGDLNVTQGHLTIIGRGTNVSIDATGLGDRIFRVAGGAQLTLQNLLLTGGTAPGGGYAVMQDGGAGGAIYNKGVLILRHCTFTNNTSGPGNVLMGNAGGTAGGDGGAIYNDGTLMAWNCTLAGNQAGPGQDGARGGNGGALRNNHLCLLTDCLIALNQAGGGGSPSGNAIGAGGSGGAGGGLFNAGRMVLTRCNVASNAAGNGASGGDPGGLVSPWSPGGFGGSGGSGGGIYNAGQLQLHCCAVYLNCSGQGADGGTFGSGGAAGSGGSGAGLYNAGTLQLRASTLSGNACGSGGTGGGGTFAGTATAGGAGGSGGGLYNAGRLKVLCCTVAANQTGRGGNGGNSFSVSLQGASGGPGGSGGGIGNDPAADVVVGDSLVADNSVQVGGAGGTNIFGPSGPGEPTPEQIGEDGPNGYGVDVVGEFASKGFNLLGIGDGSSGFTNSLQADQVGSLAAPLDPLIGPLEMNGGPTPTHALLPGSPAIGQGKAFGTRIDQRLQPRLTKHSSVPPPPGGDGSDIGAFEL